VNFESILWLIKFIITYKTVLKISSKCAKCKKNTNIIGLIRHIWVI